AALQRERELGELLERMPLAVAVNREYADSAHALAAGDELALIPPVSGGAPRIHARGTARSARGRRAGGRSARRGGRDVPGDDAGGGAARVRGLRGDGEGAPGRD